MDSEGRGLPCEQRPAGGGCHCCNYCSVWGYEYGPCCIQRGKHRTERGEEPDDRRQGQRRTRRTIRRDHRRQPDGVAQSDQPFPEHSFRRQRAMEQSQQYPEIGKDGRMDGEQFRARRYCRAAEFFGRRRDRCFELGCVDEREEKADAGRCWENLRSGWLHQQCGEHSDQCGERHDRSGEPGGHGDGNYRKCPWCWRKGCLWQRRPEPDRRHWCCGWKAGRRIYVAAWNLRPGDYEPWNHGGGGLSAGRPF